MEIRRLYILCQLIGWSAYIVVVYFMNLLADAPTGMDLVTTMLVAYILGLTLSHLYREIIVRNHWLELSISDMIPRFFLGSFAVAALFEISYSGINILILGLPRNYYWSGLVQQYASLVILFILWSLIYFFYHFFKNYKAEEIKNLKWEASIHEIKLNKLKSQLNPHFIFNSMNTIRALVDEDPKIAKQAITQLSNILRSNLLMGRQKTIPFEEEIKLVKDYLAIESYRYEERLTTEIDLDPNSQRFQVPPLMVQTLVENGIKHGISHIPSGGTLKINSKVNGSHLHLSVTNTGQYDPNAVPETGFGLTNTRERLKLLFGDEASLSIRNLNKNEVITEIKIPKQKKDED
ncbi:histidine kinase [bacterium SCSIO 12741]|nr:histidine kinase [bacterium SCSIO 12741]